MTGYERVLPMRSTTQVPPDVVKDVAFAVYSGWGALTVTTSQSGFRGWMP
jgi:hypothetical protein